MELSGVTAREAQDQFLQLLVTQLQNQDPLDPIKQEDFLSQLAQFSTLEKIENLNSTIETQVDLQEQSFRFQQLAEAATFVGRQVEYAVRNADGLEEVRTGVVDSVQQVAGQIELTIGDDTIRWQDVRSLGDRVDDVQPDARPSRVAPETLVKATVPDLVMEAVAEPRREAMPGLREYLGGGRLAYGSRAKSR